MMNYELRILNHEPSMLGEEFIIQNSNTVLKY